MNDRLTSIVILPALSKVEGCERSLPAVAGEPKDLYLSRIAHLPAEARVAMLHFAFHVGADYGRPVSVFAFARVAAGARIPHRARLFSS